MSSPRDDAHDKSSNGRVGSDSSDHSHTQGTAKLIRGSDITGDQGMVNHPPSNTQSQRNLPAIRDILHDPHSPIARDGIHWGNSVCNAPYSHSRSSSSQGFGSEASLLAHRIPVVTPYGPSGYREIHPPMALPREWSKLRFSLPEGGYVPVQLPGSTGEPALRGASPTSTTDFATGSNKLGSGRTKSGNPRKRQAEACRNCRQKKIKCDVITQAEGPPKCFNCDKTGAQCTWQSLPVYLPSSNHSVGAETLHSIRTSLTNPNSLSSQDSPKSSPSPKTWHAVSREPGEALSDDSMSRPPSKKPRIDGSAPHDQDFWNRSPSQIPHYRKSSALNFRVNQDPFHTDCEPALGLLDNYFTYHDITLDKVLPRNSFTRWCLEHKRKTKSDLMLIWATLAVGTIYSTAKALKSMGKQLVEFARELEVKHREPSLRLSLTRLHLATFFYAEGQPNDCFDYMCVACPHLVILKYHTEEGCHEGASLTQEDNEFGLTKIELVECRRRIFWHGFIAGRFKRFVACPFRGIGEADVTVRVPNDEEGYESGLNTLGPIFDNGTFDHSQSGSMATAISISSIEIGLIAKGQRSANKSKDEYLEQYNLFYDEMFQRIQNWEAGLESGLKYSPDNTRLSIKEDRFVEFYVTNACYHICAMKLNRYGRHEHLPRDIIVRNIRRALYHARQFLELVSVVVGLDHDSSSDSRHSLHEAACQSLTLETIMFACDIISSRGRVKAMTEVQHFLGYAGTILTESAKIFSTSQRQSKCLDKRLSELGAHVAMKDSSRPTWRFSQSIDESYPLLERVEQNYLPKEMDLIYEVGDETFFEALSSRQR